MTRRYTMDATVDAIADGFVELGADQLDASACWCTHCHVNLAVEVAIPRSVYVGGDAVPTCSECMKPWVASDAPPAESCVVM